MHVYDNFSLHLIKNFKVHVLSVIIIYFLSRWTRGLSILCGRLFAGIAVTKSAVVVDVCPLCVSCLVR